MTFPSKLWSRDGFPIPCRQFQIGIYIPAPAPVECEKPIWRQVSHLLIGFTSHPGRPAGITFFPSTCSTLNRGYNGAASFAHLVVQLCKHTLHSCNCLYLLTHARTFLYLVAPVTLTHSSLYLEQHLAYCRHPAPYAARQPPPVPIKPSPGASVPPQNRAGHCKCCCSQNVSKLYSIVRYFHFQEVWSVNWLGIGYMESTLWTIRGFSLALRSQQV